MDSLAHTHTHTHTQTHSQPHHNTVAFQQAVLDRHFKSRLHACPQLSRGHTEQWDVRILWERRSWGCRGTVFMGPCRHARAPVLNSKSVLAPGQGGWGLS